jgi:hypothetical protein
MSKNGKKMGKNGVFGFFSGFLGVFALVPVV